LIISYSVDLRDHSEQVVVKLQQQLRNVQQEVSTLREGSDTKKDDHEVAQIHALLSSSVPQVTGESGSAPATLKELLVCLEDQRQAVHEELMIDMEKGSGWQAREEDRLERMAKEVAELRLEAEENTEEALRYQVKMKQIPRATADVQDRLTAAEDIVRENEVMRRQQSQWQKGQLRMLRLIEDMQRKRHRDVLSQATVAARIAELQRDVPIQEIVPVRSTAETSKQDALTSYPSSRSPSPPKKRELLGSPGDPGMRGTTSLNSIWSDNVALKSKLRRLEEEKEDLIRSQEDLIKTVKSKMPTIEQARAQMRFAHQVAEPHFARRVPSF